MYEFGCFILAVGALYAGFRFWRRPRNSSVEPSATELGATTCGALRIAHTGEIGKIATEFKMQYLFDKTVAISYDKGLYVEDLLKSNLGENFCIAIDKDSTLHFFDKKDSPSKELKVSCLIAGSELSDRTFIWAWANQSLGLPPLPFYSEFANEIQNIGGGCDGIAEFVNPMRKFQQEELNTFYMSIQGWGDLDGFYRLQFGELKIVAFLNSNSFPRKIADPVERVCKLFPEVIALCSVVNHRLALEGYLMFYGFTFSESASVLRATLDGQSIHAVFDQEDKFVSIARVL